MSGLKEYRVEFSGHINVKAFDEHDASNKFWDLVGEARRAFICSDITVYDDSVDTDSIEPVKHGWWIFNPSDAIEAMFAKPKCSVCGFESADGLDYCSNCGAKMDL